MRDNSKELATLYRLHAIGLSLLFAVFFLISFSGSIRGPTLLGIGFLAAFVALCAANGFWLAFGESSLRFVCVAVSLLLATVVVWRGFPPHHLEQFLLFSFFGIATVFTVATPIGLVRFWKGARLANCRLSCDDGETTRRDEALQFSIAQIMILTAVVAVLSGVAKAILALEPSRSYGNEWLMVGQLGGMLGISSVVVVWASLGNLPVPRTAVSAVVAAGLALLSNYFIATPEYWIWPTMTLLVWAQITLLMWLLRLDGYRFVLARRGESV